MPRRIRSRVSPRRTARSPIATSTRPRKKPATPSRTVAGVPTSRTPKASTLRPEVGRLGRGQIPVAPNAIAAATGSARAWRPTVRATRPQICLGCRGASRTRPPRGPSRPRRRARCGTVANSGRMRSRIVVVISVQRPPPARPASTAAPRLRRIAPLLTKPGTPGDEEEGDHAVGSGLRDDHLAPPSCRSAIPPMFPLRAGLPCYPYPGEQRRSGGGRPGRAPRLRHPSARRLIAGSGFPASASTARAGWIRSCSAGSPSSSPIRRSWWRWPRSPARPR